MIESNTSSCKALLYLIKRLEDMKEKGGISNIEMFLFTNSMIAEYVYYKGEPFKKILFELVVRSYKLSLYG